ncbi:hypothetical protein [Ornithobacterium rhinotracheale]
MKNWFFFIVTIVAVFFLGLLISNITDRKRSKVCLSAESKDC